MEIIYRNTVAAYIVSSDGKVLFGCKDPKKGGVYVDCWHIPGGGIDADETPEQAIVREVREETGLEIKTATKHLIDDRGVGESIKQRPDEEDVLVRMTFIIYKVMIPQPASKITLKPTDDLIDLTWVDFSELQTIKLTPPAYMLFDRMGTSWLTDKV